MASILNGEQLVNARIKSERELPVIGLKEFQPSNSWLQNRQIESALLERKVLLEEERVEKWGSLSTAIWRPTVLKAEVIRKTGKHWDVFGHHKDNADWLYPEEALFLMEMNCLELLFEDVPMSIQRGYAVLVTAQTGCTLIEYRVFLHLSRQGYRLFRHDPELTVTAYEKQIRLDQYILEQKKQKEKVCVIQDEMNVIISSVEKDDKSNSTDSALVEKNLELSTTDSITEVSVESNDTDKDCDVRCEVQIQEKVHSVIQIDESDDDIIEVVYEKTLKQESENESDEEEEEEEPEEKDSDSDSDSSCGNWKRQPANSSNVQRFDNRRSITSENSFRPVVRVNYVTVNEFLYDVDLVRKKSRNSQIERRSVDEEIRKFYNEIEVIDLESDSDEDNRVTFNKSRADILDTLRLLKDSDGNVVIPRPDERFLPSGVRPKFPLYRINLDAIKSETQKRVPYVNPRPYRGRYNPNYRNRNYNNNNWMSYFVPNTPVHQTTQLQTMARSMMQMASAVLLNTMSSHYQSNWQPRYQNQIRPVHPQQPVSSYTNVPPLIYEYNKNIPQYQNNFNNYNNSPSVYNSSSSSNFERNDNNFQSSRNLFRQQPFETPGFNSSPLQNYGYNSVSRNFASGSRNYIGNGEETNSNINYTVRQQTPRLYNQGFRGNRHGFNSVNQNPPRITEYNENINHDHQEDRRNETNRLLNVKNESNSDNESNCDPAYVREDIPVTKDFIPFKTRTVQSNNINRVHIVDINDENNDDEVVIIEDSVAHGGNLHTVIKRNKRKRRNRRHFQPAKKFKNDQGKRTKFNNSFKSSEAEVITIDDNDSNVKQGRQIVKQEQNIKQENDGPSVSNNIKTEISDSSLPVKIEKPDSASQNVLNQESVVSTAEIKTENNSVTKKIKVEKDGVISVPLPIKVEKLDGDAGETESVNKIPESETGINKTKETIVENVPGVETEKLELNPEIRSNKEVIPDGVVVKQEETTVQEKVTDLNDKRGFFNINVKIETSNVELVSQAQSSEVLKENSNVTIREDELMEVDEQRNDKDSAESNEPEVETRENVKVDDEDVRNDEQLIEITETVQKEINVENVNKETEVQMEVCEEKSDKDDVKVVEETSRSEEKYENVNDSVDIEINTVESDVAEVDRCVEVHETVSNNENISNWTELKKTVSTLMRHGREEEVEAGEFDENDVQPLLKPQDCQTLDTVLSALQIFKQPSQDRTEEDKLKIMFDMYLPSVTFRKASRGLPEYRIVVIESSNPVPSPGQIIELKNRFQDDITVLLAVVMPDSISYYILAPVTLPIQQYNV